MTTRAEWLRAHGHVVLLARSLSSALEALLNNPVDATVLDCHMPEAGVIAPTLKRIRPELPLLILASYCSPPCPIRDPVDVCVAKANSPATLLEVLQNVLRPATSDEEAA
jgi:CheY-like chemotaxis protein